MDKCRNRKFVYIIGHQLSMIADMRSHLQHLHSCTDTVVNQLLHVEKKTLIYCPVHHHCGLHLPWNFEKQMVPCRTVMQLARKLRTDSPGTGKLNQICTACNGHKICVYSNRAIYIVHEVNPGLKFATTIVRWTLLQSVGPILVTLSLQCPRTLGLGLGWRRVVGWHMLC